MKRRSRTKKKSFPYRSFYSSLRLKIALIALAVVLSILNFVMANAGKDEREGTGVSSADAGRISTVIHNTLDEYYIRDSWQKNYDDYLQVYIPEEWKFVEFYRILEQRLRDVDGVILDCSEDLGKGRIELVIGKDGKPAGKIVFLRKANLPVIAGYAAIIIDDFGYTFNKTVKNFIYFPYPITLSIIPGLKESQRVRREAEIAEKEILIHMPMEPLKEKYDDRGYVLTTKLGAGDIRLRLQKACTEFPDAVGINNHQGSKATVDRKLLQVALDEIKKLNKFFIDSRTNQESIALDVARSIGLRSAANQLFLDVEDDEDYIRSQMQTVANLAAANGRVIAIGHVRKKTFKVLSEMIPQLQARGIEFVPVSKFVQ